jgi:hypothetical protein
VDDERGCAKCDIELRWTETVSFETEPDCHTMVEGVSRARLFLAPVENRPMKRWFARSRDMSLRCQF